MFRLLAGPDCVVDSDDDDEAIAAPANGRERRQVKDEVHSDDKDAILYPRVPAANL